MSTASRKQREIQEREAKILDVSRPVLVEQGYHGLNMDRIAETLQYSKGTIYGHFSCKEEIIIALAIQTMEKRMELFCRATAFNGFPRERLTAIGFAADLFVQLHPDHFKVEQIVRSDSIWGKTSEKRRSLMRTCEQRSIGIVVGVVLDAIARGDLQLPDQISPEELVFGLWAQSFGAYSIISTNDSLAELGIREPFSTLRDTSGAMLDGLGWRPLTSEHDYDAAWERIQNEVFADECRTAVSI